MGPEGTGKAATTTAIKDSVSGENDFLQQAQNVIGAVGGAFVPALGLLDDSVNAIRGFGTAIGKGSVGAKGGAALNGTSSAVGAMTSVGPLSTYGPIAPIVGISTAIGVPAGQRMTDDKICREDADMYRKYMGNTAQGYRVN